jgi:hypothetical protein
MWIRVVVIVFVLGSQFPIASHQLPVKRADVNAKAASTVPPAPPQVDTGQSIVGGFEFVRNNCRDRNEL